MRAFFLDFLATEAAAATVSFLFFLAFAIKNGLVPQDPKPIFVSVQAGQLYVISCIVFGNWFGGHDPLFILSSFGGPTRLMNIFSLWFFDLIIRLMLAFDLLRK